MGHPFEFMFRAEMTGTGGGTAAGQGNVSLERDQRSGSDMG